MLPNCADAATLRRRRQNGPDAYQARHHGIALRSM